MNYQVVSIVSWCVSGCLALFAILCIRRVGEAKLLVVEKSSKLIASDVLRNAVFKVGNETYRFRYVSCSGKMVFTHKGSLHKSMTMIEARELFDALDYCTISTHINTLGYKVK